MDKLTEKWQIDDMYVKKAELSDCAKLHSICKSWTNKRVLEGEDFPNDYIEKCISDGDLPPIPNADISNYMLMVIKNKDGNIAGFFDIYQGYPQKDCVWISIFVIDDKYKKNGIGRQVVSSIIENCRNKGWKHLGVGVHLKNWSALRFWNNNGFSRIHRICGDKEFGIDSFSVIALIKDL